MERNMEIVERKKQNAEMQNALNNIRENKGITLIALVITIIVLLILVGVSIVTLMPGGLIDKAIESRFVSNYRTIEEGVYIYKAGKEIDAYSGEEMTQLEKLPLKEKLTVEDKREIQEKIPTLEEEIIARNPGLSLEQIPLYEIDKEKIGATGIKHKYIMDITTEKIYDYEGETFRKRTWHTLEDITQIDEEYKDIFNGWIRLTLYYPENSTDRKWLLKGEGEIREEDWKDYTGPIWVQLDRVQDIYIKYKINDEEIIIPPSGKVGVIIEPEKYQVNAGETTKVKIVYDANAVTKEYKVGNGSWQTYNGEFQVGERTMIYARAKRVDNIYDAEGNKISEKTSWGYDNVYIRRVGDAQGSWQGGGSGGGSGTTGGGGQSGSSDSGNPGGGSSSEVETPAAPTIQVTENKNGVYTESVDVTVQPPMTYKKIYIKIGSGKWEEYTKAVRVQENTLVSAYYTTTDGKTSKIGYKIIDMIQKQGKPYVSIKATPYPYPYAKNVEEVTIEIVSRDAERVEYSTDGVIYKKYESGFKVTENCVVSARAINEAGVAYDTLNITNIGDNPTMVENLGINIIARPDPIVSSKKVEKVEIEIEYDERAEERYYSIGKNGEQKPYEGAFEITENATIYAYAKSKNGVGQAYKVITNLNKGIIEPEIIADPQNSLQASSVKIKINYDPDATVKQYEIDGGGLVDYTGEFKVEKNCTIRAYNENSRGEKAESIYKVENITEPIPPTIIDLGDYYIIKLNYPEGSTGREYKIKEEGEWTGYKEAGILLVKPEYKDKLLDAQGNVKIQIVDETGKSVNWQGTVYVIEGDIQEILEEISMRWDTVKPETPQIVLSTEEPAREVQVSIIYKSTLKEKQYKIIEPDGSTEGWKDYEGSFTIKKNNTVILAKGMNQSEVWGEEAEKQITNIDEQQPEIKLTADLEKETQTLQVKVDVTDDTRVAEVKWAEGVQGESYFAKQGESIPNNSTVTITKNGYYTFYAEDGVGNKQVYTINVINIDTEGPEVNINVTPEQGIVIEAKANIDYGDSVKNQYKIGEKGTWQDYTGEITLSAYDIINQGLLNSDKTVTIYAKGTDRAGNVTEVSKIVSNIDLDMPEAPQINSNYGYPILTEYGVEVDGTTEIIYDDRDDIDNFYSLDNGNTWLKYEGSFTAMSGTIRAKSVKKESGLEIETSKEVSMPADAIGPAAYDGDDGTVYNLPSSYIYMNVDESMWGKKARFKFYGYHTHFSGVGRIEFIDNQDEVLDTISSSGLSAVDLIETIPNNTVKIRARTTGNRGGIYEIQPANEAIINVNNHYPRLTEYGVEAPYSAVTIDYSVTSVQRLYKIDDGEWKEYNEGTIRIEIGQTIYAKGIDKNGDETRVISSYTATIPTDAIGPEAYDGNDGTVYNLSLSYIYMNVDESMWGKRARFKFYGYHTHSSGVGRIEFIDNQDQVLDTISSSGISAVDLIETIPNNTVKIRARMTGNRGGIYEIQPANEAIINVNNHYPRLTEYGVEAPYSAVTIDYSVTSVQRLYKIDDGEWKEYNEGTIRIEIGQTIYAKGIDKNGDETRVISSYTAAIPTDAIGPNAYDGQDNTSDSIKGLTQIKYMDVDESMWGKNARVYIGSYANYGMNNYTYVEFLNEQGETIDKISLASHVPSKLDKDYEIKEGTTKIKIYNSNGIVTGYCYEIQIKN